MSVLISGSSAHNDLAAQISKRVQFLFLLVRCFSIFYSNYLPSDYYTFFLLPYSPKCYINNKTTFPCTLFPCCFNHPPTSTKYYVSASSCFSQSLLIEDASRPNFILYYQLFNVVVFSPSGSMSIKEANEPYVPMFKAEWQAA